MNADMRAQVDDLVARFQRFSANTDNAVEVAIQKGGLQVQRTAMEKVSIGVPTRPVKYRSGMVNRKGNSVVPDYDPKDHAGQAPYLRTGLLRASMTTRTGRDDSGFFAEVGSAAPYASWVELGTSKAPPHPFLVPSLDENRDTITQDISSAVKGSANDA